MCTRTPLSNFQMGPHVQAGTGLERKHGGPEYSDFLYRGLPPFPSDAKPAL